MSTYAEMARQLVNPWALGFMIVGVVATSFHLGVGIWNFLCKWGLAATARAQRAAGQLGVAVGLVFTCVGILIVLSFRFDWHPFASYLAPR
jgi:succinate dehydrogenase / fumarate reductase cytochrome b subunit